MEDDTFAGVSSLRARFEQLSTAPPTSSSSSSSSKSGGGRTAVPTAHGSATPPPALPPKPGSNASPNPAPITEAPALSPPTAAAPAMAKTASNDSTLAKRRAAPPPPPASRKPAPSPSNVDSSSLDPPPPSLPPRPAATKGSSHDAVPPLPARPTANNARLNSQETISDGPLSDSPEHSPSQSPRLRPTTLAPQDGPPAIPARPKAASTASSTSSIPPPPIRSAPGSASVTPRRPSSPLDEAMRDSDDEDADEAAEAAALRSQESPDSTFANRRPPILTGQHTIRPAHPFVSFALRSKILVTGHTHLSIWHPSRTSQRAGQVILSRQEIRITAVAFVEPDYRKAGDLVWCATREGHLFAVDVHLEQVVESKPYAHSQPITHLFRNKSSMISVDESGKVNVWGNAHSGSRPSLADPPQTFRFGERPVYIGLVGTEIWTAYGSLAQAGNTAPLSASNMPGRGPSVRVWDPTGDRVWAITPKPVPAGESSNRPSLGNVTASAIVPENEGFVYLAHDNGCVSIWDRQTHECVKVQRVSTYAITCLAGIGRLLWMGFRNGFINIYDVLSDPWMVQKAFRAHTNEPVAHIVVDPASLWLDESLHVASAGHETIESWDGFLQTDWMDRQLDARQKEFCTYRTVKCLCVSWNVDAQRPDALTGTKANADFFRDCLTSVDSPDIISFGFQELIDLEKKSLTAKSVFLGRKRADSQFSDKVSQAYRQWHDKLAQQVRLIMPPESPYVLVDASDMVGLFSCVFVKKSEHESLRDVSLVTVKTGVGGHYGNKGAILARFVIDDSSVCIVNCHLAAGQNQRRERDKDVADILETKGAFSELNCSSPGAYVSGGTGTSVFDHEIVIFGGDLNYRIEGRRDTVAAAIQAGKLSTLYAQDQLLKNLATNHAFRLRSFKEQPLRFAPTYKYDRGSDVYDSGPKKRIPAWCDRILYRTDTADKIVPLHYKRYEVNVSDHRPISAAFEIKVKKIDPSRRAVVWDQIEREWIDVEEKALEEAQAWYCR